MQEFFEKQAEWLKTWQENQQSWSKQYAGCSQEWMENMFGKKGVFDGWFKPQESLVEQFDQFSRHFQKMADNCSSIPAEFQKLLSFCSFEEFYKNYLSFLKSAGEQAAPAASWQEAANLFRSSLEKNNPFHSAFSDGNFADGMSRFFSMLHGFTGPAANSYLDTLRGYQDLLGQLFESTTSQGVEKLAEGFKTWAKEMEKYLLAPKLGINREMAQEFAQTLVTSQEYIHAFAALSRLIEATCRKAGGRFQEKLGKLALTEQVVTKFTDLCALWTAENEAVFLEVLGSEEFARLQGDFLNSGHRLKMQLDKLAEKVLEPTPIALKRDLDLAIAEIQQMKREMKKYQRSLLEREKETLAARTAQAAAEEGARQAKLAQEAAAAAAAAAREEVSRLKAAKAAATEEGDSLKAGEGSRVQRGEVAQAEPASAGGEPGQGASGTADKPRARKAQGRAL
jgi:hypothetical protein